MEAHPTPPLKPRMGEPCNGCGHCCTMEPCQLAQEFLQCTSGPCIALEAKDNRTYCGLVRNPLGYLYMAMHPEAGAAPLEAPVSSHVGNELSCQLASALGLGLGCDAGDEDGESDPGALQLQSNRPHYWQAG